MRSLLRAVVLSSMVALTGCGTFGALGQASVASDGGSKGVGFERPIAVGATLRPELKFSLRGAGAPALHYETTDASVLSAGEGTLQGRSPGMSGVLLVTDDGVVVDFFHVWVKGPTSIALSRASSDGKSEEVSGHLELMRGEAVVLSSSLRGEGQELAGEAEHVWSVKGGAVRLLEEGRSGRRRLVATAPGEAMVDVAALDRVVSLKVTVHDRKEVSL
jgi:hypothetical protein